MMDIYANAGRLDKVIEIFQNRFMEHRDFNAYSTLMKAYGNCNLANISEQILVTLLNEKQDIDIHNIEVLFHTLINAWSISSAPDAIHRAIKALKTMKEHPTCIQNNIQPNVITYTTLLNCFSKLAGSRTNKDIDKSEISRFAEEIIAEMENISGGTLHDSVTDHMYPNFIPYTTAIKLCLTVQDYTRSQAILLRFENSDNVSVPTKFYSELIHQCTLPGTAVSAIQGEKFLFHMIRLSKKQNKPSLTPNERLFIKVINTWIKSNDIDSSNRVWNIYDKYLKCSAEFDLSDRTYDLLIPYFATASTGNFVEKADQILQRMEEDFRRSKRRGDLEEHLNEKDDGTTYERSLAKLQPSYRHYVPVIKGYLDGNDVENATKVLMQQIEICVDESNPMKKRAISPIPPTYLGIVNGWIELGQLEKASFIVETVQDLFDEGKICYGPCVRTYSALLQAYVYHPVSPHRHHNIPRRGYFIKMYKVKLNELKKRDVSDDGRTSAAHSDNFDET
jgi:ribosome-associated toxin RatA of RatAB toxin-antitoxin module